MKILFVSSLYEPDVSGGAERTVQVIAEGMASQGADCAVVCLSPTGGYRTDRINGVGVHYVPLANVYWPFANQAKPAALRALWHALDIYNPVMLTRFRKILLEEKPDIVSTHTLAGWTAGLWRLARYERTPLNHTLHDYWLACPKTTMFRSGRDCSTVCSTCRVFTIGGRSRSNLVDSVVGNSHFTLERHIRLGFFEHVGIRRVIHNGLRDRVEPKRAARSGALVMGYLGRIAPTKGVGVLLRAIQRLAGLQFQLLIAGKGEKDYVQVLQREFPDTPAQFLGYQSAEGFLDQIDLLVVPSLWEEPLGNVVFEAYASGVPVLASSRGGLPEIVEEGVTGFLFDPSDDGRLQALLTALIQDPQKVRKLGPAAARKAESFTQGRLVGDYGSLFDQVMRQNTLSYGGAR